jgi:hypothetical protein
VARVGRVAEELAQSVRDAIALTTLLVDAVESGRFGMRLWCSLVTALPIMANDW